ncbi:MAG: response regulator transcription factor [Anaerolineae bacterium]|nr:response regulator transcription factor [Anaerolineae bacterium]
MLELIGRLLEREGYRVQTARSVTEVSNILDDELPDLFLIDVYLSGMDGLELCRQLRKNPATRSLPVIFVSDQDTQCTVAEALQAGGDDFVRKPFAVRELTARMRAQLRRFRLSSDNQLPVLRIYPDTRTVMVDNRPVELTQVEYELLRYLCLMPEKLHSTQELLIHVWNYPSDAGDAALVRNHIRNLRRKLEDSPERPEIIQSRHGRGYTVKANIEFPQSARCSA